MAKSALLALAATLGCCAPAHAPRLQTCGSRAFRASRVVSSGWENHALPGATAFVVELPAGMPSARATKRYARAVLQVRSGSGTAR